ncbi:MAG: hypothetical protein AAF441_12960 [Pseudomonadota bacterium]
MKSGPDKLKFRSRGSTAPAALVFTLLAVLRPEPATAQDVSEALRLWKFTYHMEAAAYGIQHMSKDLLKSASRQLETASNNTVIATSAARFCLDAATELGAYFKDAAETEDRANRIEIRIRYEAARADCMRALGANPAEYPLGWPDQ